jgi:hypothetical protein
MDPFGIESTLLNYLRAIGWSIAAAIGFSFGVASSLINRHDRQAVAHNLL